MKRTQSPNSSLQVLTCSVLLATSAFSAATTPDHAAQDRAATNSSSPSSGLTIHYSESRSGQTGVASMQAKPANDISYADVVGRQDCSVLVGPTACRGAVVQATGLSHPDAPSARFTLGADTSIGTLPGTQQIVTTRNGPNPLQTGPEVIQTPNGFTVEFTTRPSFERLAEPLGSSRPDKATLAGRILNVHAVDSLSRWDLEEKVHALGDLVGGSNK